MFFRSFGASMEMKGGGGGAAVDDDYDDNRKQQQRMGGFLLPKQQLHQHHEHHQAPLQQQKPECCSEEVDSRSGDAGSADSEQRQPKRQRKSSAKGTALQPPAVKARGAGGGDDGETVEVTRRPRGRPPGSKNKPRQPVVITRDADDAPSPAAMRPHVFEVPDGQDVVEALSRFSRRRNLGLCVLGGSGLVSNVILRQPSASPSPPASTGLSFSGCFEILSISATFLPPSFTTFPPSALLPEGSGGVSISLAGPHGQLYGGLVAGPVTAVGTVTILAATFSNPTYHRLPAEDEVSVSVSVSVSGGVGGGGGGGGGDVEASRAHASQAPRHQLQQDNTTSHHHQQQQNPQRQQQQHHHHHCRRRRRRQQDQRSNSPAPCSSTAAAAAAHHHNHHPAAAIAGPTVSDVCGMPIYSCHLPSDVLVVGRTNPYDLGEFKGV